MNTLESAQNIYFAGIGGVGMSGLAQLLHADGKQVSGSDLSQSSLTALLQEKGIGVQYMQNGQAVTSEHDLLIYSDALPENHPERKAAAALNIPTLSYFKAVGEYAKQFTYVVAVAGTHGKSTTTALTANVLVNAGLNPTALVGTQVRELKGNARPGGKEIFVVEACEHQAHMLHIPATMIVLTNIEADHLDYYKDLDEIVATFQRFVNALPENGVFIRNTDDKRVRELEWEGTERSFGIHKPAQLQALDIRVLGQRQLFVEDNVEYEMHVPGEFNILNALGALGVAKQFAVPAEVVQQTFNAFRGTWRRFELLGTHRGIPIISDYGHHPTEVRVTIEAARSFYPKRRVAVLFQPHQRARTKHFFSEFLEVLAAADTVIVEEVFDVAGRDDADDHSVNAQQLVDQLVENNVNAFYAADHNEAHALIVDQVSDDSVLLVMGAGNVYTVAESLVDGN